MMISSDVLGNREDVPVRILEPGNFVSSGRGPDAQFVLVEEAEDFKENALALKGSHDALDAGDLPSQDRELRGRKVLHLRRPYHGAIRIEDQSESVVFDEAQSEYAFVKGS